MRVLITSTEHRDYNQSGRIVQDQKGAGLKVKLDRGEVVLVPEGQFKIIPDRDLGGRDL